MSFGKLAQLTPLIAVVAEDIKKQLPALDNFTAPILLDIIMRNLGILTPIIAAYVDDTEENIKNLPADVGVQLAFTIWSANAKIFLDFFIRGSQLVG